MEQKYIIPGGTPLVGVLERHGRGAPSKLVTSLPFAQLRQLVPSPQLCDNPRLRALDPELDETFEIRAQTQRLVEGAKKKNLVSYAEYEASALGGQTYTNPPVTLEVVRGHVDVEVQEVKYQSVAFGVVGLATVTIAPGAVLATIDGDTHVGALFHLSDQNRKNAEFMEKLLAMPVSVELYVFEEPTTEAARLDWGRQAFYDRNVKGVRPNSSLAIGMDGRDGYTHAMRELEDAIPELRGRIDVQHRQLGDQSNMLFTASVLRQFIACFAEGSRGLQKKTVLDVPPELVEQLIDWTRTLLKALGTDRVANRKEYVCAAPAVFVGLGMVGHALYRAEPKTLTPAIVNRLVEIDWSRNKQWAGVAGKVSPKGTLTFAGPKEAAGLVFEAITKPSTESYKMISAAKAA